MSKFLILGSNSFSGAHFVSYCLNNGHDVIGVSRSPEPHPVFLPYKWSKPSTGKPESLWKFYQIDINKNINNLFGLIAGEQPNYVVNFAAQSMVGESWDSPQDWMQTNVVALSELINFLQYRSYLEKYVHITTPEVYGSTLDWIKEDAPFNPSTPYAVSRAAGDMLLQCYLKNKKFPVCFTRAANVYGEGQQLYRIIPKTIMKTLLDQPIALHGDGLSQRSFIHISDVCSAMYLIATDNQIGVTYHISTDTIISIKKLVNEIFHRVNVLGVIESVKDRPGKDSCYMLDSSKIKNQLNWNAKINLGTGLDKTIKWVKDNFDVLKTQPMEYRH